MAKVVITVDDCGQGLSVENQKINAKVEVGNPINLSVAQLETLTIAPVKNADKTSYVITGYKLKSGATTGTTGGRVRPSTTIVQEVEIEDEE